MTQPSGDESVRWECLDGRWISITLVDGVTAYLCASSGFRQICPSFAEAVALAERLRVTAG